MSLALASAQPWMWGELWRWQAEHYYDRTGKGFIWEQNADPPREGTIPRPCEPDHALFVTDVVPDELWELVAGLGLHETRSYIFLDDLTTNPDQPGRARLAAVNLLLQAAQQYAVSVAKPICAFTSVPSLYRMARRLGFKARPAGALLVYASASLSLNDRVRDVTPQKNRAAQGAKSQAARLTVDGEKRPDAKDNRTHPEVPRQRRDKVSKDDNGQRARRLHPR